MKKMTLVLTAIVTLFASTTFAADGEKVTERVQYFFQQDFAKVTNLAWKKTAEFYFATFTVDNQQMQAAYNQDGELVGSSKEISTSTAPKAVTDAIAKKYAGYDVSATSTELTFDGRTSYYVVISNNKAVLKLKVDSEGAINVESKKKIQIEA